MPRPFPAEFRLRAVALVRAGKPITTAAVQLGDDHPGPKGSSEVVDRLIEAGYRAKLCCRLLGVSSPGYYKYKNRALSPTQMRRLWLTGLINEVHIASRQTYGSRRIHASSRSA